MKDYKTLYLKAQELIKLQGVLISLHEGRLIEANWHEISSGCDRLESELASLEQEPEEESNVMSAEEFLLGFLCDDKLPKHNLIINPRALVELLEQYRDLK